MTCLGISRSIFVFRSDSPRQACAAKQSAPPRRRLAAPLCAADARTHQRQPRYVPIPAYKHFHAGTSTARVTRSDPVLPARRPFLTMITSVDDANQLVFAGLRKLYPNDVVQGKRVRSAVDALIGKGAGEARIDQASVQHLVLFCDHSADNDLLREFDDVNKFSTICDAFYNTLPAGNPRVVAANSKMMRKIVRVVNEAIKKDSDLKNVTRKEATVELKAAMLRSETAHNASLHATTKSASAHSELKRWIDKEKADASLAVLAETAEAQKANAQAAKALAQEKSAAAEAAEAAAQAATSEADEVKVNNARLEALLAETEAARAAENAANALALQEAERKRAEEAAALQAQIAETEALKKQLEDKADKGTFSKMIGKVTNYLTGKDKENAAP